MKLPSAEEALKLSLEARENIRQLLIERTSEKVRDSILKAIGRGETRVKMAMANSVILQVEEDTIAQLKKDLADVESITFQQFKVTNK